MQPTKYAVEYRDMHTAIHNLLICNTSEDAHKVFEILKDFEQMNKDGEITEEQINNPLYVETKWAEILSLIETQIEIDYRNVNRETGIYCRYMQRQFMQIRNMYHIDIFVINYAGPIPDIY